MKFLSLIVAILLSLNAALGQCVGNLLNNGSFNSPEGELIVASGWTGGLTPDVNDALGPLNTTPGYTWTGTPVPSSDGGTWQNIFGPESIEQTITVTPGQTYALKFEYAAQGINYSSSFTFTGPVGVEIYLDGTLVHTTPDDLTQYTWEKECFTFVATSTSVTIKLMASQYEYVAIDGACVIIGDCSGTTPTPTPTPIPASTLVIILEMPNVFSPNHDGINDLFRPIKMEGISKFTLSIYNRWGALLSEETDNAAIKGWDGSYNGKACSDGVYYWVLNYTDIANRKSKKSGFLTLVK